MTGRARRQQRKRARVWRERHRVLRGVTFKWRPSLLDVKASMVRAELYAWLVRLACRV